MNAKLSELIKKLREIFQIDDSGLDFGIYRIISMRRKEINNFLEEKLPVKVQELLSAKTQDQRASLEKELEETKRMLTKLRYSQETAEPIIELTRKIESLSESVSNEESLVYSHLLTFFSRYYDDGDFISQRRYKGDVYAIPYAGEEVKLHWANADQYYTKSGLDFRDYAFAVGADRKMVHFKIVTADTAKDNNKDNNTRRCFVLWDAEATQAPEDSDEANAPELPSDFWKMENGSLSFYFQYKECPKGTKQDTCNNESHTKICAFLRNEELLKQNMELLEFSTQLLKLSPTEKDKKRTVLKRELERYMAKNTRDYFIHKNLRAFLTQELDFYIKNEMLHLDNISAAEDFKDIKENLHLIQTVRAIAIELINFMAQLEDFQKKLWLKKKFVVQCEYCFTLDRVPSDFLDEILANKRQQSHWEQLGFNWKYDVKENRYQCLMVDTGCFPPDFKDRLLASIQGSLDDLCDGVLVHSENFQALNLLQNKYQGQIKCIYIDPPYNSKTSEILYKNTFKHAAWLTLMENRLSKGRKISTAPIVIAIDENEQEGLGQLLNQIYPTHNKVCVSIVHNKKGIQGEYFSFSHEFAYFCIPYDLKDFRKQRIPTDEWEYTNLRKWGSDSERETARNCFYPILVKDSRIIGFGPLCREDEHPSSSNIDMGDGVVAVYPIDGKGIERKWRFQLETVPGIIDLLRVKTMEDGVIQIEKAADTANYKTVWTSPKYIAGDYGTKWLTNLGLKVANNLYPKSLHTVADSISMFTQDKRSLVLDYFAGAGTTGHAVINMNRDDKGMRKYVLIEMGDHFKTVIRPRIEKIVYSPEWKDGKPVSSGDGISHGFKYMRLEGYEDTLNNLTLQAKQDVPKLLRDEYLLKYMLEIESRDSLLSTKDFQKPFDYKLKISESSSNDAKERKIDMLETFNYLLGLHVESIEKKGDKGYAKVVGTLPNGERAFILWRDCEMIDNVRLNELLEKEQIRPGESEYDVIYVNGDHSIPNVKLGTEEEGRRMKVLQIENAFLSAMFECEEEA